MESGVGGATEGGAHCIGCESNGWTSALFGRQYECGSSPRIWQTCSQQSLSRSLVRKRGVYVHGIGTHRSRNGSRWSIISQD